MSEREGFIEKRKRLLEESVKAFSSALKGETYVPDSEPGTHSDAQPAPSPSDKYNQLAKLEELRERGALTEEEFQQEKAKLLGKD